MRLILYLLIIIPVIALPQEGAVKSAKADIVEIGSQPLSEEVLGALKSEPDKYGIPRRLYLHDRELNRLKTDYRDSVSKREKELKTSFTYGPLLLGTGILLWVLEESDESTITYYNGLSSYVYAVLSATVGSGVTIYGVIEYLKPAPTTSELLKYYNSKYSAVKK